MKRVLAARQDNNGDVILCGPALRAIAREADVTLLCGPRGEAAARLLPDVSDVIVREAEWIDAEPHPVDALAAGRFVSELRERAFDEAIVFTSFHQSPLPLALLLRMAGVPRVGAICVDYPGSLLDVRHSVDDDVHEVERALSLAKAMGYQPDPGDSLDLRLAFEPAPLALPATYLVVHPGATVPARAWYPERSAQAVTALSNLGWTVAVTGSAAERSLAAFVAGKCGVDVSGMTTFAQYAGLIRGAAAVICGNTAAAHVAAAVGTPVVSIFPPTIPVSRFAPWNVPHVTLGDQDAPCAGCRARICPVAGQPCLDGVTVSDVVAAVEQLTSARVSAA